MNVYALVAYFDSELESKYKKLWTKLREKNISDYGFDIDGKRPHITIADYDNIDKLRFMEKLDRFYVDRYEVEVSLSVLGSFIGTGTLFFAPRMSFEIQKLHNEHHEHFRGFNKDTKSLYLPGKWIPHCTVASRLDDCNMTLAYDYCRKYDEKLTGRITEIGLIEIELNEDGIAVKNGIAFSKKLKLKNV